MDKLLALLEVLAANWKRVLLGGIILVTAIVVIMGLLKSFVFNKLKNKLIRKVALAFSSIALVFPAVAIYMWLNHINFHAYYLPGCGFAAVATVITYWLYENTALRELIHYLGSNTLLRVSKFLYTSLTEGHTDNNLNATLAKGTKKDLADAERDDLFKL